jgi:hypothetical protein
MSEDRAAQDFVAWMSTSEAAALIAGFGFTSD